MTATVRHSTRRRPRGFTLIELMIVVAIVAILAAIAYPAYQSQVRESRRSAAKAALQDAMNREERHYTTNNEYTADMTDLGYANDPFTTEDGWYEIDGASCGSGLGECVELTATAQDDQANDACGNFTLDSRGDRGASGTGDCW